MINFSQNACHRRFEALASGIAKPTPESIPNPDEDTCRRIQSRREKEQKIAEDNSMLVSSKDNVTGNAWTSRMRIYY